MRSIIPLSVIATDLCDDMGDTDHKYYSKMLRHAKTGFQQLHKYVSDEVSVKSIIIDTKTNVIEMPCDFMTETKVGLIRGKRICVLKLDPDLVVNQSAPPENDTACDSLIESILSGGWDGYGYYDFFNPYYNGNRLIDGFLTGCWAGTNLNGYYNIDRVNGVIETSTPRLPQGTKLIVEYKADGVSEGLSVVPSDFEMAIKYWSEWHFNRGTRKGLLAKEDYVEQYGRLKKEYTDMPVSLWVELFVQHKNSGILS